jgi:hypothetical protein
MLLTPYATAVPQRQRRSRVSCFDFQGSGGFVVSRLGYYDFLALRRYLSNPCLLKICDGPRRFSRQWLRGCCPHRPPKFQIVLVTRRGAWEKGEEIENKIIPFFIRRESRVIADATATKVPLPSLGTSGDNRDKKFLCSYLLCSFPNNV